MKNFIFTIFLVMQSFSISFYAQEKQEKKEYYKKYNKQYYQEHKERYKKYYQKNREKCLEKSREQHKKYYQEDEGKKECLEKSRVWYEALQKTYAEQPKESHNENDDLEIAKILDTIFTEQAYCRQYYKYYYQDNREKVLKKSKLRQKMLQKNRTEKKQQALFIEQATLIAVHEIIGADTKTDNF